jgi:ketosteroid isomerase-like protein
MTPLTFLSIHHPWRTRLLLLISTLVLLVGLGLPGSAFAQPEPGDLESLAFTRELGIEAVNTRDFSKIAPYLHPTFTITTVDNQVFHSAEEFEAYWNEQFSDIIEAITLDLQVDEERVFLSPKTEVAYGFASSTFDFKSGHQEQMPMRWTAVMQKVGDDWLIQSIHFSSNLFNNPVLASAQRIGRWGAIAAGLGGLVVGAIAVWFFPRGKRMEEKSEE